MSTIGPEERLLHQKPFELISNIPYTAVDNHGDDDGFVVPKAYRLPMHHHSSHAGVWLMRMYMYKQGTVHMHVHVCMTCILTRVGIGSVELSRAAIPRHSMENSIYRRRTGQWCRWQRRGWGDRQWSSSPSAGSGDASHSNHQFSKEREKDGSWYM